MITRDKFEPVARVANPSRTSVSASALFCGAMIVGNLLLPIHAQDKPAPPPAPPVHHHQDNAVVPMENMQHDIRPLPPPTLPRLGMAQATDRPLVHLEELEELALKNNPTLSQAASEVAASKGRQLQAGLWPNPTVGYSGEEIRGGSSRGGQQGFFVEQQVLLGSKLALNRKVLAQEIRQAELEQEEQEMRVKNAVRLLYYQALAAQEMVAMWKELSRIASETLSFDRQLSNLGQQNETEVLQAEIEAEEAELAMIRADHEKRRAMSALAAVVADPSVADATLGGSLEENLPSLDEEQALAALLRDSPAVRIAQAGVDRAEVALARSRREAVPDLLFRGGLQQNRELQESSGRPVGLQGFAEVGLQLKIFDRNQGNSQAAQADLERARNEVKRVSLVLRERAASFIDSYSTARTLADRYRTRILPLAQKAYERIYARYGLMQASYPQVLDSQHNLYKLEIEYVSSLNQLWSNAVALKGFLLTDGLEAPARPSDVDRPVRELNLPSRLMAAPSQER